MGANIWEQAKQVCCDSSLAFIVVDPLTFEHEFEVLISGGDCLLLFSIDRLFLYFELVCCVLFEAFYL